jgi:hypothetical protein
MGLFKKVKEGLESSAAAQQMGAQVNAQNAQYAQMQQQGMIGVQGASGMDPAMMGGPSNKPLDPNDPLFQPINGVSLEQYATHMKAAQKAGHTDEASIYAYIEATYGIPAADMQAAAMGWIERMKQSMVIGQQFNKIFMAS